MGAHSPRRGCVVSSGAERMTRWLATVPEAGESQVKMLVDPESGESSPRLQTADCSPRFTGSEQRGSDPP